MADDFGLPFNDTALVLQLSTKCKKSAADFHHLDQDLQELHQTLLLTEPYLPRLAHSRKACDELVLEIQNLLLKHERRPVWRRGFTLEEIEPVRTRLHLRISTLHACATMLRENDYSDLRNAPHLPESGQSSALASTSTSGLASNNSHSEQTRTRVESTFSSPRNILKRDSCSSFSSSSLASDDSAHTAFLLTSFTSIASSRESSNTSFRRSFSSISSTGSAHSECSSPLVYSGLENKSSSDNVTRTGDRAHYNPAQHRTSRQHCNEYLRTPLISYIVAGRKDLVEAQLRADAKSLEKRDGLRDWTPLIWAVMEEQPAILELLIRSGADVTAKDSHLDRTALLWAASTGNKVAVELLLWSDNALVNAIDKDGKTSLDLAYFEGHMETAQILVKAGSFAQVRDDTNMEFDSRSSLLAQAIAFGHEDFARLLLEHGTGAQGTDNDGIPALILAIQRGYSDIAEILISKGAFVQCKDEDDTPALTVAVKSQGFEIANMLIEKGADLEAKDGEGNTALLWAVWLNDERMVEILVGKKADVAAEDGEGITVRDWAARMENENIIQLLPCD